MRLAYAVTTFLVAGASVATLALQSPVTAQTQPQPVSYSPTAPRPGAPASFADLVEKLQPAVVNISTKQKVQVANANPFAGTPFEDFFGQQQGGAQGGKPITREAQSLGSGFIISPDGYIVTNNHVVTASNEGGVRATVSSITVVMPDRSEYVAKLVGHDATSDLAVLKIDGHNLPFVNFGDSSRSRVGDWVIAIGEPLGLRGTVTAGIISAIHRNIGIGGPSDSYIQTDAAINKGNSGGPLFNMNGEVIGINSIIQSETGGSIGLGFAIPSDTAKPIVEKLRGGGAIQRGYLGVQVRPLDDGIAESLGVPKNRGELVASTVPGGAAAKAGIRQGDVVMRVNNIDVTPDETLSKIVAGLPVNSRVPIEVLRNGSRVTLTAMLAERPAEDKLAQIGRGGGQGLPEGNDDKASPGVNKAMTGAGLMLQAITPEIAQQLGVSETTKGCVVAMVDPESDAGIKGIQRGDIILSINQQPVATPAQVNALVAAARAQGRNSVLLLLQRGNNPPQFVAIKVVSDK